MTQYENLVYQLYFPYKNFSVGCKGTEKMTPEDKSRELNHKKNILNIVKETSKRINCVQLSHCDTSQQDKQTSNMDSIIFYTKNVIKDKS